MGADEKHAATYHGGQYTPSVLAMITAWVDQRRNLLELTGEPPEGIVERTAQAQRTIAKIRAEAKAEAWDEAVNWYGEKIACPRTCGDCAHCREDDTYNPYK